MPPSPKPAPEASKPARLPGLFAGCMGYFLGLAVLKFGNPPIMEKWVTAPTDVLEFLLGYPWPITWAYVLLAGIAVMGLAIAKSGRPAISAPTWLILLPAAWAGWQVLAAAWSEYPALTWPTTRHFLACITCFYLGLLVLPAAGKADRLGWFWAGLGSGFAVMLTVGWEQRLGGLEQSRQYFFMYLYPSLKEIPPEYLKKISSTRIFSTLFYPNSLAGELVLLLPATMALVWVHSKPRFTLGARQFLLGAVAVAGLACLFWSGSKGGWLLMLLLGLVASFWLPWSARLKVIIAGIALILGLAGFFWKYSGFFAKGATSVVARFDYWHAAGKTALANPVFGTGPGTFAKPYEKLKRPESEMSRLVHNDYLQQASDSGFPGFFLFASFMGAAVFQAGRNAFRSRQLIPIAVWLGLLGWSIQSLVEFGLYLPALSWPALTLLGWLLANQNYSTPRDQLR